MLAVVLVGGEGTRLRPLTNHLPKPMLPIVERPMIVRVIEWLGHHGVDEVVLALGYKPDAFVDAFPEGHVAGVTLTYATEPTPLDTAGAIRFAALAAGVRDEPLVVVNGDVLTDLDLGALVEFHRSRGARGTIALTPVDDPSSYGVVPTDADGRVLEFIEKPKLEAAPTNLVNAGSYVLEPSVLELIAGDRRVSIEREIFPQLVEQGGLFALASDAYWLDTGTPERFLQAQMDLLRGLQPALHWPGTLVRQGAALLAEGAELLCTATGHVFLGIRSRAERGAHLEDCVIGATSSVAEGARVIGSVLLAGAKVCRGAVIEGSVVGPGATIGAGAVLRGATVIGADAMVPEGSLLDSARLPV